ncbi:MAG: T9SS type A sorting domain-containing protein [Rhodothermales bacterium]
MPQNQKQDSALHPVETMLFSNKSRSFLRRSFGLALLLTTFFSFGIQDARSQTQVIDFENHAAGEILEYVAGSDGYGGIKVSAEHPACPTRNAAIIFDSSCPGGNCTGGDDDLGTPNATFGGPGIGAGGEAGSSYENDDALGNLLIIHQVCGELTSSPVANPRDFGGNATVSLTFPTDVTIFELTTLDVEGSETLQIDMYDKNGAAVGFANPVTTGDNGKAVLSAIALGGGADPVSGVRKISVVREGSGALDNIVFRPDATADLELTKTVDNPAPDSGATVVFTLALVNQGPDNAANVTVDDRVPAGLSYTSHMCDAGVTAIDVSDFINDAGETQQLVSATLDEIAAGESVTCTVTVSVDTGQSVENIAEVMTSDAYDPDSTPGNNLPDEDDQDDATVTPGQSSGGGSGGIESDGNMATHLARRLFNRRVDAQQQAALFSAPEPLLFTPTQANAVRLAKSASGLDDLRNSIPEHGPHTTIAYEVTPRDLLGITNATGVLAVDYLQVDGRRLGAIFSTTSPTGELYDHTKTSCDRLGGGMLEDVRLVEINDNNFVLSKLRHASGDIDYAISFVAYRSGSTYTIDSRFSPNEYEVPQNSEVINIQVWGVAPEFTQQVAGDLLNELGTKGSLIYGNSAAQAPQIYVADGEYTQGAITLRIANKVGATQVTIRGTLSNTEADAEQSIRTPFERTISLSAPTGNQPYSEVSLNVGSIFDAVLTVEHESSQSLDQLYHADGTWSYASGDESEVEAFATASNKQFYGADKYIVERSGSIHGKVKNWVSLFRYLQPNGQSVDLSDYSYMSFTASGTGDVRLIAEKASIKTWDQYGFTFGLTTEPQRFSINFSEMRKESMFDGPFTAEDITLLAFYALGDGQQARDFSINIENVTFGGASIDENGEIPTLYSLDQNYPNPFNPVTQISFGVQETMHVRLSVYDMLGREVAVLVDGLQSAGAHEVSFEAGDLTSGLYMYRIETPQGSTSKMMSLLK